MVSPAEKTFWIIRNNEQCGPYCLKDVSEFLKKGDLSTQDLAWSDGETEWKPLAELLPASASTRLFKPLQIGILCVGALALIGGVALIGFKSSPQEPQDNAAAVSAHAGFLGGTEEDVEAILGSSTGYTPDRLSSSDAGDYARNYSFNGDRAIVQYSSSGKARTASVSPTRALPYGQIADFFRLATGERSWSKDSFIPPKDNADGSHAPACQKYVSGSGQYWALDIRNEHPMVSPWIYEVIVFSDNVD